MNSGKQRKQRGLSLFFRLTSHRKPRISAANELPAADNFLEKQRKQRGNDKASGLRLWLRAWTTVGRVAPIAKPTDTPVIRKVNACRFPAKAGGAGRHAPSRVAIRRKGHSGAARRVIPGTARQRRPPGDGTYGHRLLENGFRARRCTAPGMTGVECTLCEMGNWCASSFLHHAKLVGARETAGDKPAGGAAGAAPRGQVDFGASTVLALAPR